MLVVFGEHVLIFSDKHCEFPSSDDLSLDWSRWYRRAIRKSAEQAWGAERWLKTHPGRVYIDSGCTQKFPLPIPNPEDATYHIIVVAHGCETRCRQELGGRGSLILRSIRDGNAETKNDLPFTVGDLDESRTFVHVLNDSTLDLVLETLDTITDFVMYLDKKEKLFRSPVSVLAAGEEDLLALYLKDVNDEDEHDFIIPKSTEMIVLEDGMWEDFCRRPERLEQLRQNSVSYAWDTLIERFGRHALNATQYFSNHTDISATEIGLRFMASETRFARRIMSRRLFDMFTNTPDGTKRVGGFAPMAPNRPHYVFLALLKPSFIKDHDEYRQARGNMLEACCMVMKLRFPNATDIVGIASEPFREGGSSSEDLIYLDARDWTEEQNNEAIRLQKELKILVAPTEQRIHEEEYPDPTT